ncbi:hypothetical protein V7x_40900 [Crateriforma conspicua]|uniref:Uncharacterized protein n=1 Tax=Crateriforma conspicua TaxID=2527996 RepID=A0A5C6FQI6_9PLAN|nr:hypothetical protein [Crateriforma conspicua]TWU62361.1 hypothetical protein V7x_40900 [Crateriforma conspicua]
MAKQNKEEGKKPAFESRLGNIRVSVWQNTSDNGDWFNTVITRRYKDGDEWRDTNTFNGLADLALVAEAYRLARQYITEHELGFGELAA